MIRNRRGRYAARGDRRPRRNLLRFAAAAGVTTAAMVVSGVAFARFSAPGGSGSNKMTAGTVSLSAGTSSVCSYSSMFPGDALVPCTFGVNYTGNASSYIGLDVYIATAAGSGGNTLYTANSGGLTLTLSDGTTSFTVPTSTTTTGCPTGDTCYQAIDELAASAYTGGVGSPVFTSAAGHNSVTFSLTPSFPATVANGYMGGSARITLTAHAVQSSNNVIPAACKSGGNPIIGASCNGLTWS